MSLLIQPTEFSRAWGLTILRIVVGTVFLLHGGQKLFVYGLDGVAGGFGEMGIPLPMLSAVLAIGAEFVGGLLLIIGLFTRLAAIPLAFTMLVAAAMVHRSAFFLPNGAEYVLVLMAASITFVIHGGGALAMDNLLAARRSPSVEQTGGAPVTA